MRVYCAISPSQLRQLHEQGECAPTEAVAADEELQQEWDVPVDDDEVAEFAAMSVAAADSSDELVIVIAVDVGDDILKPAPGAGRRAVSGGIALGDIASIHVGRRSGSEPLDAADLSWWAVQELPELLASLAASGA